MRQLETAQSVRCQVAFAGKQEKRTQHGNRHGPMRQTREAEATHQRNRPEEIDHVVDIEPYRGRCWSRTRASVHLNQLTFGKDVIGCILPPADEATERTNVLRRVEAA